MLTALPLNHLNIYTVIRLAFEAQLCFISVLISKYQHTNMLNSQSEHSKQITCAETQQTVFCFFFSSD